jgi:hypothetical protein
LAPASHTFTQTHTDHISFVGAVAVAANMSTQRVGLEALVLEQHIVVAILAAQMAASQGLTPSNATLAGNSSSSRAPGQGADAQVRSSSVGRAARGRAAGASGDSVGEDTISNGLAGLKARPPRPVSASSPGDKAAVGTAAASGSNVGSSGAKGLAASVASGGPAVTAAGSPESMLSRFHCYLWVLVANCCSHPVLGHALASQSDAVAALALAACSIPAPPVGSAAVRIPTGCTPVTNTNSKPAEARSSDLASAKVHASPEQAASKFPEDVVQNMQPEAGWLGRGAAMLHMSVLGAWQQLLGGCPWALLSTLQRCSASGAVPGAEAVALHVLPLVGWVEAALLADAAAAGMLSRPCRLGSSRGSPGADSRDGSLPESTLPSPRDRFLKPPGVEQVGLRVQGSALGQPKASQGGQAASAPGPEVWSKVAVSALSVAGAAAGMLGLAVAAELVTDLPQGLEGQMLPWLTQLMLLPTLPAVTAASGGLGLNNNSSCHGGRLGTALAAGGNGDLEHAAAQAALCCWALTTNPSCGSSWGVAVSADTALPLVMLELVASFQGGGTRARYSPARIMSSLCLGQLAVLDLLQPEVVELIIQRESGVMAALGDATSYALLPDRGQQFKQQQAGKAKETRSGKAGKVSSEKAPVLGKGRGKGDKGAILTPLELPKAAGSPYLAPLAVGNLKVPRSPTAAAGTSTAAGGACEGQPAEAAAAGNTRTDRDKGGKWAASDPAEVVALQGLTRLGLGGPLRGLVGLQAAGAIAHLAAAATTTVPEKHAPGCKSSNDRDPKKAYDCRGMQGPAGGSKASNGGGARLTCSPRFTAVPSSTVSALVALLGSSIHEVQLAGSMALAAVAAGSQQAAAAIARQAGFMEKMRQILQTATDGRVRAKY